MGHQLALVSRWETRAGAELLKVRESRCEHGEFQVKPGEQVIVKHDSLPSNGTETKSWDASSDRARMHVLPPSHFHASAYYPRANARVTRLKDFLSRVPHARALRRR